jgi:hypothetical protein
MTGPGVLPTMRHVVHDVVDGSHSWGTLDQAPARSTVVQQITLRVFRPGTSLRERRLLHVRQIWPVAGAICSAVSILVLASRVPAPVAAVIALAVYGLGFLCLDVTTTRLRATVRELTASSTCTPGGLVVIGDSACVRATAARLVALEREFAAGHLSLERYSARWNEVYTALPTAPNRT